MFCFYIAAFEGEVSVSFQSQSVFFYVVQSEFLSCAATERGEEDGNRTEHNEEPHLQSGWTFLVDLELRPLDPFFPGNTLPFNLSDLCVFGPVKVEKPRVWS